MFDDISVNQQDVNGDTAAHLAARQDHVETLYIIENHPKYVPAMRNKIGMSPYDINPTIQSLKIFCANGSASSVGAMLGYKGRYLVKPLEDHLLTIVLESKTEQCEKLKLFLRYCSGSEIAEKYVDNEGKTLYHIASIKNYSELLRMLIDYSSSGSLINRKDVNGYTPWDYASLSLNTESLLLLEAHPMLEQVFSIYEFKSIIS